MSVFVVVMDAEGSVAAPQVLERLREKFPEVHKYTSTCFLVSADSLTKEVAEAAGLRRENGGFTGVVFRLDGYSGFTDTSLWEWISKVSD